MSDHAAHEPENGNIDSSDRKYSKHNKPAERMSRYQQSRYEMEIEHKDAEVNDTEARSRREYLLSREEIKKMQNDKDENRARSKVSQIEDYYMRYPYSRQHSEAPHMDRLRSSHACRGTRSEADGLQKVVKGASEHENGDRCVELDRYSTMRSATGRGSYKERERSRMDRDRRSSSTRHKDDDGRRKDKSNDSCKISADREMRHFRANKMDARQTGELNGDYEHNDSTRVNYGLPSNSKEMPIYGEKCRESNHRRKRSEEIKDRSCK
jgi:serine/threonine-protein kinase PRP4